MNFLFCKKLFLSAVIFAFFCGTSESAVTLHYPKEHDIGQPFVAFISSDAPFEKASVVWFNKKTPLEVVKYDDGYRAYALLGAAVNKVGKGGKYPIGFEIWTGEGKRKFAKFEINLRAREYPSIKLKVPPKMVNPPKSELKRIEEESKLTARARSVMTGGRRWEFRAAVPVVGKPFVTNSYGYRRIYNGVVKGQHSGVDLRAAKGSPISAVFSGKVVLTGNHYFAGSSVYIDSGNGVISAYFHLNSINVRDGDFVSAGDVIGQSGATGRVTGPHLHLSVFLSGHSIDPMGFFDEKFLNIINSLDKGEM